MSASDERQHPPGNSKEGEGLSLSVRFTQQQQQQQQHEDYDWMGVLDTLDDHFDLVDHDRLVYQQYYHQYAHHPLGNGNAICESEDAVALSANVGGIAQDQNSLVVGDQPENQRENRGRDCWEPSSSSTATAGVGSGDDSNNEGVAPLMVASTIADAAAAGAACGDSGGGVESISISLGKAAVKAMAVVDAEADDKKQSRVERKRTREKKRRLDTNSQFTALAELVKEIEATDLAEEALFDFDKPYDKHDGQEEDDKQYYQQRQDNEGGGPNISKINCSDSSDNQQGCERSDGNVVSKPKGETMHSSKMIKSVDAHDISNNSSKTLSSLVPTSTGTTKPPILLSSTSSLSSSTATSNRIDLIARTIVQLNQFRMLRRRRNNELRDCQRKNCELRKECEGLHRLVAQYKAMGKMGGDGGYTRPQLQEKVMMMVPMMVPQDAVSQIAAGYPAAHQYQAASTSYSPATTMIPHHPFFNNMTNPHPWMGSGGGTMMSPSTSYHRHNSTTILGGSGMQLGQQQYPSLPPSSQLQQYNHQTASAVGLSNLQPSGGLRSMSSSGTTSEVTGNGVVPAPPNLSSDNHFPAPHGMWNNGAGGNELPMVQEVSLAGQTQALPDATTTAAIEVQQHPLPQLGGTVSNNLQHSSSHPSHHAGASTEASAVMTTYPTMTHVTPIVVPFGMHPQHFHHSIIATTSHNNASMPSQTSAPYYPSQGHDTVSPMVMNHSYQHSHPNPSAEVGAPNNNIVPYSSFVANDASASPAHYHHQQQQQLQPLTQHHNDESEKPLVQDTTTHHGGGGNLAHCA